MKIKTIAGTSVYIPYEAPIGPYIGRGGLPGTLGARGLIVRVETDAGLIGWGEGTGAFESDPNVILAGKPVGDIEGALSGLEAAGMGRGPMSGIEMALWDLLGKAADLPLCLIMGGLVREEADFCACMGLKEPSESASTARAYVDRWGFSFLKTKAGVDAEQDLRIAEAVQREVGDTAVFRPDANGGYAPEDTESIMRKMHDLGIRFFEDPCSPKHPDVLARVRQEVGMGILVNMGVSIPEGVRPVLEAGAADMLMPDTPASGGLIRVRKIAAIGEAWGVPCLMHCSHDLGLKTAAVTHMAASSPNFSGPSDTCYHGLIDDILSDPLEFENGKLRVPMGAGLGVEVDPGKVEKYRA